MRNRIFYISLFLLLATHFWAAPVTPNLAQQVAENFINAPEANASGTILKAPRKQKRVARAPKQVVPDQQFYIFNSEDGEGFVIVAADDVAHPILGYSKTGSLEIDDMPDNMRWWISEYDRQIHWAQENNIAQSDEIAEEWRQSLTNQLKAATPVVAPLIKTKWAQEPYYNVLCPYNSIIGTFTVTGCVATAMAQVMKYWEWPIVGSGYHTDKTFWYGDQKANFGATYYDWRNMPDSIIGTSTSQQMYAVAKLMYHCGVATDMDYGYKVSSAGTDKIPNAVKSYFRYSPNTQHIYKKDYSSDAAWLSVIKGQLDQSIPIIYGGNDPNPKKGGHAFVCDGYDNLNMLHFNWGWGNGFPEVYYAVTSLDITGYNFKENQRAVINMVPQTNSSTDVDLQLSSKWILSSDSIPYGGTLAAQVSVKNLGTTSFVGDIIAMVLDKDGNYFTDYVIEQNCTIAKNATKTFNPYVSGNAGLVPGRYYVALFCRSNDLGYQIIGAEYYQNLTTFKVYYQADIETFSDFEIYSDDNNQLVTGHPFKVSITVKNTRATKFSGNVALVLFTSDLSNGQEHEISLSSTGVSPGSTRALTFSGTVTLDPGTFLLALMYKDNNGNINLAGSTYYANPIYVIVKGEGEDQSGQSDFKPDNYVILAQRDAASNWFYMTSDLGSAGTKRYQAVDAGTSSLINVNTSNLDSKYYWQIEDTKLHTAAGYSTWTAGNSATLDSTGKDLFIEKQTDGTYIFSFIDGDNNTRRLALNKDSRNNYFAYYKGQDQIYKLTLIKEGEVWKPENLEFVTKQPSATKLLRNGQILILRGNHTYTLTGQEVK